MDDLCCSTSPETRKTLEKKCPQCGQTGKAVQGQTVKALVSTSLRQLQDTNYFFCRTPTCPVVYFSADARSVITKDQVRERVYQKEPGADDVLVCYCFQHSLGDIRKAAPEARDAILQDINAGIQANQCACDIRNPQGACCLGNIRKLMKQKEVSSAE